MTGGTTRRNACVLAGSALTLGLLLLAPTSTNSGGSHRRPGQALAPAGIISGPLPGATEPSPSSGGTPSPASVPPAVPSVPPVIVANGISVDTPYGPVQVQVRVRSGHLIKASAIDYPRGAGRSDEINRFAVPMLDREAMTAQGAQIDTISGATYTSDGYRRSLQAALDAAHL